MGMSYALINESDLTEQRVVGAESTPVCARKSAVFIMLEIEFSRIESY
jgi:hypothetical protein